MKEAVHLFFDLDRTIWDYENNSRETLEDLWEFYVKPRSEISVESFIAIFREENTRLWDLFTSNKIDKDFLRRERFYRSIQKAAIDDRELGLKMEDHYLDHTPSKKQLLPGAIETLEVLSMQFRLHIITNGFEDVQHFKLKNCGIDHYFEEVITSDGAGSRKPNPDIFEFALNKSGATKDESVMIGDDPEIDIGGAIKAGWPHTILVNTMRVQNSFACSAEVDSLPELIPLLYK
ncbi:MAG: YjjG family noncanonical pyrimidine nucleotidase [Bacteroidia bacterium]